MRRFAEEIFGAAGQLVVGVVMLAASVAQTVYWTAFSRPGFVAIFLVSMEALAFGSFNQIASALGLRATKQVHTAVIENDGLASGQRTL